MTAPFVFPAELIDVFETKWEARVVKAVLMHGKPGEKITIARLCELVGVARDQETAVKRGVRTALDNGTLREENLPGKTLLRTLVPGPKLAGVIWAQSVPGSYNDQGTDCAQTSEDLGTQRAQRLSDSGTKCAQNQEGRAQVVPKPEVLQTGTPVALSSSSDLSSNSSTHYTPRACEDGRDGTAEPDTLHPDYRPLLAKISLASYGEENPAALEPKEAQRTHTAALKALRSSVTPASIDIAVAKWSMDSPPYPDQLVRHALRVKGFDTAKAAAKKATKPSGASNVVEIKDLPPRATRESIEAAKRSRAERTSA